MHDGACTVEKILKNPIESMLERITAAQGSDRKSAVER
jgi:hypothetical protein